MYARQTIIVIVLLCSYCAALQHQVNLTEQDKPHKCSLLYYTSTCLKLDLLKLMTYFGKKTNVNLLPGVTIFSTEDTKDLMADINSSARNVTEDNVDTFLKESAIKYLGSLNITMQVGRSNILPEIQSFTNEFSVSGRKRKGLYTTLGTLAAIAFAMLAALTGKALMASLLALLISAISALRGGGIGAGYDYASSAPPAAFGKVTQYDIITRPIVATPYQEHDHHHYNSYIDTYAASGRNIAAIHQDKDTNNEGRKL